MAKTVSSAGLADFIATGKPTEVFSNDQTLRKQEARTKLEIAPKPPETPAADSKPIEPVAGAAPKPSEVAPEAKTEAHDEPDDLKGIPLSEAAQKRLDKWLAKRTATTKNAQEEAAAARKEAEDSERFAETLFNEREQWRKRAEEAEKRTGAEPAKAAEPPKKPVPADFTDEKGQFKAIEYAEALASWSATEALNKREKETAEKEKQAETERFNSEVKARIDAAQAKYPDWEKKVTGSDITMQNECLHFMAESEHGMDIAYYLADNPKEAARIRAMRPLVAVAELGKLQTRFEKAAEPAAAAPALPAGGAPPPITPISTSGATSVVVDPAKMNFKQLREWHKERRKAGIERR